MMIINQYVNQLYEPEFGLRYKHFTDAELEFIQKQTSNNSFVKVRWFRNKYNDLKAFEKALSPSMINNSKPEELLHWYIIKLIQYDRISVDIDVLVNLRIRREYIFTHNSYLIDLELIGKFEDYAINKLKYSMGRVERSITIDLVRLILCYQMPLEQILTNISEYLRNIEGKIPAFRYINIQNAINVLSNMGYKIDYDSRERLCKKKKELTENQNPLVVEAINQYVESQDNKTEISNIRTFFNFMWEEYPEVNSIQKISPTHIEKYIERQKSIVNIRGNINCNATINNRLESLDKMFKYLSKEKKFDIPPLITKFDKLKEVKKITKYISKREVFEVVQAVYNETPDLDSPQYQYKLVLIILIETGRRIHEVLSLKYDCLKDGSVFFHKTKNKKPNWQIVGEAVVNAVRLAKELAQHVKRELYSSHDNNKFRRLFPSAYKKGAGTLSIEAVSDYFEGVQIKNNIMNENGKAKFTLHDNKRNFVTSMLNAGVDPCAISKFLVQKTNSLVPYEVNNETAIKTLKSVEKKGYLIGKSIDKVLKVNSNPIVNLLMDANIIKRHAQNIRYKINNPKDVMPLSLGYCIDYYNFDTCGDLICLACDEFKADSTEEIRLYVIKMYRYILMYKRNGEVKKIEEKMLASLEKIYSKLERENRVPFKSFIKSIKNMLAKELEEDGAKE